MSLPTKGEEFAKLIEHMRKAQESAAMLAHLCMAEGDNKGMAVGRQWLKYEDLMKRSIHIVTELAKGNLQ
jgi:hypothetical protein